ncbi:3-isopropylmalate dehydratase small subunit [bacterium]|nr:3-isopropylmalate dehydratase small subunit [bacterium]
MIVGKVWKYGDDINTDVIFPGKYTYTISDRKEMAEHALEDLDSEFAKNVQKNDIIVAGKNFGCGSSREQAATCIKEAGAGAIIAKSFSRLFFRNAINEGLPVVECPEAVDLLKKGDTAEVDFINGKLKAGGKEFDFVKLPPFILEIFNDGGLLPHTKRKLDKK